MLSAQQVSSGATATSGPSWAAQRAVTALLDSDVDFTPDDIAELAKRAGVGQVQVKAEDTKDIPRGYGHDKAYFITRWNVYLNGKRVGYITRSPASLVSFYGYSTVNDSALKGTVFTRIRDCIRWVLSWDVGYEAARNLAVNATIEESEEEDEISMSDVVKGAATPVLKKGEDGRDVLYIPHMAAITPQQWEKISGIMRGKGYDSRGAADASRAIQDMLHRAIINGREERILRHDDWVDAIVKVLGLKAPSQKHSTKDKAAMARKVFARATKKWGLTSNPDLAGYILPNGTMLDLSGGSGVRAYDHRQVGSFLDPSPNGREATEIMHEFMGLGAIRWMPEGPGMYIRVLPTRQQYATIARIKDEMRSRLYLDVYSPSFGQEARDYGPNIPGQRVVNDIAAFYKTGKLGHMSQVQKFHGEAIVAALLGEAEDAFDDVLGDIGKVALQHTPSIVYRTWKQAHKQALAAHRDDADEFAWKDVIYKLFPQSTDDDATTMADYLNIRGLDAQSEMDPEEALEDVSSLIAYTYDAAPEQMSAIESLWRSIYIKRTMHEAEEQPDLIPVHKAYDITPEEIAIDSGIIDHYKQVDGDFGDSWVYGGTWFNAYVARTGKRWDSVYHINGLESEGLPDYDSRDKDVQARLVGDRIWRANYEAKRQELLQQYLIDQSDDDNPATDPETVAWCEREAKRDAADEVGSELAEIMNAERKITVYRTNDEDLYQDESQKRISMDLRNMGLSYEEFEKMSPIARICLYGGIHGWEEIDHQPIKMTKAELESHLKTDL